MELKSRFTGCLLGLALGDALGAPFEGSPRGEKSLTHLPPLLRYTDDTEMAIGVAESLTARRGFDSEDMAGRFIKNFHAWRGYGPGTIAVLNLINRGTHPDKANRMVFPQGSFGNGAAMRSAPIGLFFYKSAEKLKEVTHRASSITHGHPLAKEGALLITAAVQEIIQGKNAGETLEALIRISGMKEYREKLQTIRLLLQKTATPEEVVNSLGNSVLALESAPTAVYAFLRYGDDYLRCIEFCLSLGGDTDTISAMAGTLSGAYVGEEKLPENFLQRLENRDMIKGLSEGLFRESQ